MTLDGFCSLCTVLLSHCHCRHKRPKIEKQTVQHMCNCAWISQLCTGFGRGGQTWRLTHVLLLCMMLLLSYMVSSPFIHGRLLQRSSLPAIQYVGGCSAAPWILCACHWYLHISFFLTQLFPSRGAHMLWWPGPCPCLRDDDQHEKTASGARQVCWWRPRHRLHHQEETLLHHHPRLWQTSGNS